MQEHHSQTIAKKNGLSVNKNYRPVSNLSYISTIIEKAADIQVSKHMK